MYIERSLISILGEFEYICAGVHQDVYDEKIVEDLLASTIINAYYVFEYYIKHLRYDMRHGGNRDSMYKNFEKFAKKLSEKNVFKEVGQSEYIVPFGSHGH